MMDLKDKYLDRIADALEEQMGVSPKLIGGNVLKPNIYRIADALDPEPTPLQDGTLKNPLARIAEVIESGEFGGKTGLLHGSSTPDNHIGSNGDWYFFHNPADVPFTNFLRTNYTSLSIVLDNWIYRTSDKILFTFRNVDIGKNGNWPMLLTTQPMNTKAALFAQFNLYERRHVINLSHAGAYSGDTSVSYESPYDYESMYSLDIDGNSITILKNMEPVSKIITLGDISDEDTTPITLFPSNNNNTVDTMFIELSVWRKNKLIHKYVPIVDGIYDIIENDSFMLSDSNHINGDLITRTKRINNVYYKYNGNWIDITDLTKLSIEDIL